MHVIFFKWDILQQIEVGIMESYNPYNSTSTHAPELGGRRVYLEEVLLFWWKKREIYQFLYWKLKHSSISVKKAHIFPFSIYRCPPVAAWGFEAWNWIVSSPLGDFWGLLWTFSMIFQNINQIIFLFWLKSSVPTHHS